MTNSASVIGRSPLGPAILLLAFWAAYGIVAWFVLDHPVLITLDSPGYIHYNPIRTAGYPAFVMAMQALGSIDFWVPLVQLALACFSGWFLCVSIVHITGWWVFALGFSIITVLNPYFHDHNFAVMTDSFFTSGLCVIAGCLLFFQTTRQKRWLVVLSVMMGWLIITRPVAWALVPLLPFIVLTYWPLWRDRRTRLMALSGLVIPCAAILWIGSMFHHAHHPVPVDHPPILGITAFGKAAMMNRPPPPDVPHPAIAAHIQKAMGTRMRILDQSSDPFHYLQWHADSEAYAQYQILRPDITQTAQKQGRPDTAVMWDIGWSYITTYPLDYLLNVAINWLGFWTIMVDETQRSALGFLAAIAVWGMGVITACFIAYGTARVLFRYRLGDIRHREAEWIRPFWLVSLFIHGYGLLTVMTCVEVTRYIAAIFPLLLAVSAVPIYGVMRYAALYVSSHNTQHFSLHRQG